MQKAQLHWNFRMNWCVLVLVQQRQVCFSSVSSFPDTMKPKRFHTSDLKTTGASAISYALSLGSPTACVFAPVDLQTGGNVCGQTWADGGTRARSL